MTWLIACECSGRVREAMLACGVDAVSCDYEDTEIPGPHIKGDVLEQISRRWRGVVAHPPCTYLCNSGVQHLYHGRNVRNAKNEARWDDMYAGAKFFNEFKKANAPMIAIENPIMHPYSSAICGKSTQFVQPWWFGDEAFKATGFWLYGLPKLAPTKKLVPPKPGTSAHRRWSSLHYAPPGPTRQRDRSRTFPGIASAIAWQWGFRSRLMDCEQKGIAV